MPEAPPPHYPPPPSGYTPPPERPTLVAIRQAVALWPVLVALLTGAAGTWGWLQSQMDDRIAAAVQAHDRDLKQAAHPSLQTRIETLEDWGSARLKDQNALNIRTGVLEAELRELYWFQVGDKAAELEPRRTHKARTAAAARERFRRYTRDGEGLKDAFRHALEARAPRW